MLAGRSIARPDSGCPARGRVPDRRSAALRPALDCDPDPEDPATRADAPDEEDPPELGLDPLRGAADPDLPLDDEDGVREPAGVWGISTTRGGGSGPLAPEPPPDDPPDEPELDPAGRGIAWAFAAAGTASANATAKTTRERGLLSMTMHSFNESKPDRAAPAANPATILPLNAPVWNRPKPAVPMDELSPIPTALALRGGRPYDASSGPFVAHPPCDGSFL